MINLAEIQGELKAEDRDDHIKRITAGYTGKDFDFMEKIRERVDQKETAERMLRSRNGE